MMVDRKTQRTRALLRAGAAAGPLFVAAFLAEGANRPGYSAGRHPVSSLSLGPGGWQQRLNFVITGGLYLAGAVGLWRSRHQPGYRTAAGPILVSTVGLGLLGAGTFATDPINNYPPGAVTPQTQTRTGRAHDLCSTPVFLCLPTAAFVYAHASARAGQHDRMVGSISAAAVQLVTFGVAGAGFSGRPALVSTGGIFQRISLIAGFGWLSTLCARASLSSSA